MTSPPFGNRGPAVAVILAAGAGSRMSGRPATAVEQPPAGAVIKPLLPWGNGTLVSHAAWTGRQAGLSVTVVVGAYADAVSAAVPRWCRVVRNERWAEGPGTSIAAGVGAAGDGAGRVVILPCDTPRVQRGDLRAVAAAVASGATAAAAVSPDGVIGPPACFAADHFAALRSLPPERGAKRLLTRLGEAVVRIPLPHAFEDLDTPAQYAAAVATRPRP